MRNVAKNRLQNLHLQLQYSKKRKCKLHSMNKNQKFNSIEDTYLAGDKGDLCTV